MQFSAGIWREDSNKSGGYDILGAQGTVAGLLEKLGELC